MLLTIGHVLDTELLARLRQTVDQMRFEDGRKTAGWHARDVKNNEQAQDGVTLDLLRAEIGAALLGNSVFAAAVRPKALTPLLISRTAVGGGYGTHVDSALMGGLRTDVSFTVFLSSPDDYDGGELVIETAGGEEGFKLPAGATLVYSAGSLHRVAEVTRGQRTVAVGWAQSFVRSAEQREILFDLETAQHRLFMAHGKTPEFDLIAKTASNLVRMWAET